MIFVTGGTGFLGRNLLPMLSEAGHSMRVLTRDASQHPWLSDIPNIEIIEGDIEDKDLLMRHVQGCQYIIHAAGKFRFWGKPETFRKTNLQGTLNILEAAQIASIEKFIHISTVVVIGNPLGHEGEINEEHPVAPADHYQHSKLDAENAALERYREDGLPVVVLRPGAFYGPHGHYAFNNMFFEDPIRGFPIGVNQGKLNTFPAYIKDVAQAILLGLNRGRAGEIYNICSQYLTHREVDKIIAKEAGISPFHIYIPGSIIIPFARVMTILGRFLNFEPKYPLTLRSYIFNDWRVSNAKAQHELGFQPTPFAEGVRETLEWYREIGFLKNRKSKK